MKLLFGIFVLLLLVSMPFIQSLVFNSTANQKTVVNKEIKADFLENIQDGVIVLFFGYVGCERVCTPLLQKLSLLTEDESLKSLSSKYKVVFVNLTSQIPKEQAQLFASAFNEKFVGLHLNRKELLHIEREFNLYFTDSFTNPGEVDHTDHIYLLHKSHDSSIVLEHIYNNKSLDNIEFINDIISSIGKSNVN